MELFNLANKKDRNKPTDGTEIWLLLYNLPRILSIFVYHIAA